MFFFFLCFFVFCFLTLENLNFLKELKILIDDFFFFFENNLRSTSPMPLVPRPFLKIFPSFFLKILVFCFCFKRFRENWFFFLNFFFWKYEDLFIIKKWRRWRWRRSKSDEDLFMMIFFFFEKPILWMRTTLAESWCGLLDKSLLNSCKKIISISNGFIHWNELEVLTQCP